MTLLDWMIVLCLNGAVIAFGFYRARGTHSSSEWFLGGRSLPWWGLGLSMFATSVDNADVVSLSGHSYNHGVHIITIFTLATVIGASFSAFCVVPVMYRAGYYTNAEFLEARFGRSLRALSALIQIQYRTSALGAMVFSIHLMLQQLTGFSSAQSWALIVTLVILTAAYTVWGGLTSVVWTDALQSLIIMAAAIGICTAVWNGAGGWSGFQEKLNQSEPVVLEDSAGGESVEQPMRNWLSISAFKEPGLAVAPAIIILGWCINGVGYFTVNHTQSMRLMGARSMWDMKMAALVGCLFTIPIMIGTILLGVWGRVLYPGFTAGDMTADQLFPFLFDEYLGVGIKGLVVAGIVSAAISTFDSMGSALSALFTRDIYARWIKSDGDDSHYLKVTRWATVGILLLGFLYVPFLAGKNNMVEALISLVPVFVTPLFTVYLLGITTRVHQSSGLIGLFCGGAFGVLGFVDRELADLAWVSPQVSNYWYAFPCSMAATAVAMLAVTAIRGRAPQDILSSQQEEGWLSTSREGLPPLCEHPFKNSVPVWAQPRWFALALIAASSWLVFGLFW